MMDRCTPPGDHTLEVQAQTGEDVPDLYAETLIYWAGQLELQ